MLIKVQPGGAIALQDALAVNIPSWMMGQANSLGSISMELQHHQDSSCCFSFPIEGLMVRGLLWDAMTLWLNIPSNLPAGLNASDIYFPRWIDILDELLDSFREISCSDIYNIQGLMVGKGIHHIDNSAYKVETPIRLIAQLNEREVMRVMGAEITHHIDKTWKEYPLNVCVMVTPRIRSDSDLSCILGIPDSFVGLSPVDISELISSTLHANEPILRREE